MSKIICVGNSKTVSSSILTAANILGYSTIGWNEHYVKAWNSGDESSCLLTAQAYDFLYSWPWRCLYQQLDAAHPGSKFILSTMNSDTWADQFVRHIAYNRPLSWITEARIKAYGFDPEMYLDDKPYLIQNIYEAKNAEVQAYFASRPDDLLTVDFNTDPTWDALCTFLGKPIPDVPFPVIPAASSPVILGYGATGTNVP
jgi:hypothetical protein